MAQPRPRRPSIPSVDADSQAKPIAVRGSDVVCRKLAWLWQLRVSLGKLTLLVGDPEQGKSFLTLDMAARVTRGRAWPDQPKQRAPRGSVIVLSAEDHSDDTIVPRLKKAGANLDKCVILKASRAADGLVRPVSLDRDLGVVRQTLLDNPDCRLVVIDPISAYLGQVDGNSNTHLRSLLFPLAELAAERGVAVVMVSHLNKRTSAQAMYRTMGSMAFVAVSRAAWLVVRDPKNEERRLMLSVKNNLTERPKGMAFRLSSANKQAIAKIAWENEPVEQTLAEALEISSGFNLAEQRYRDHEHWVVTWLREQLSDGPKTRIQLWLDGMFESVSKDQLYRAAKRLGVVMRKKGMTWDDADWLLPEHLGKQFPTPGAANPERDRLPPSNAMPKKPEAVVRELQDQLSNVTDPAERRKIVQQSRRELDAAFAADANLPAIPRLSGNAN